MTFFPVNFVGIQVYYDGQEKLDVITACIHPNDQGISWIMPCIGDIIGHFEHTFDVPYEIVLNAPGCSVIGFQWNAETKKVDIVWQQHYRLTPSAG